MVAKNDVTGDNIKSKVGNLKAYGDRWERIFGKKRNKRKKIKNTRKSYR